MYMKLHVHVNSQLIIIKIVIVRWVWILGRHHPIFNIWAVFFSHPLKVYSAKCYMYMYLPQINLVLGNIHSPQQLKVFFINTFIAVRRSGRRRSRTFFILVYGRFTFSFYKGGGWCPFTVRQPCANFIASVYIPSHHQFLERVLCNLWPEKWPPIRLRWVLSNKPFVMCFGTTILRRQGIQDVLNDGKQRCLQGDLPRFRGVFW